MESISDIIISENEQNGIFSKKKKNKDTRIKVLTQFNIYQ